MLKSLLKKFDRIAIEIVILIFLGVFVVLYFAPSIFYNIPSGHVGVMWLRFGGGTVTTPGEYVSEGLHAIWPWDKIYVYDARLQKRTQIFHVLASDGLRLKVDIVYRYRIKKKDVGLLQKYAGQDWADIMLAPSIAAKTRDIVSQDTPREIYSTRRLEIQ
ncbi:MAG: prohibitin family protein, partial [Alphaproteobacteria bacterium]|nr:prohibitin family protein [Alphaproteobacteria bacterium]